MKLDSKVFWKNAKQRRMNLEMSQDEVAKQLGFSAKNYSAKERGVSPKLPMSLAEGVASALDTTVEELMNDDTKEEIKAEPIKPGWETSIDSDNNLEHLSPYIREIVLNPKYADIVEKAIGRYLAESALLR